MWTNLTASVITLVAVTSAVWVSQWRLTAPTGDFDRDRTHLERVLQMKPCFVHGVAQPRLGEVCVGQSEQAAKQGDFLTAAEPLSHLLSRAQKKKPLTGYEEEAERRLRRLPQRHFDYAKRLMEQGKAAEARELFKQMEPLYPYADRALLAEAKAHAARCWLAELNIPINKGQYEEALEALKDLLASDAPTSVKEEAYAIVPDLAEQAVRRRLQVSQIKEAFEVIRNARAIVEDRPDLVARLDDLRDWVGRQLFDEPIGKNSAALPAPIWAGPPSSDAPDRATLSARNSTSYPLRMVVSAGVGDTPRHSLSLKPGESGRLVLPPGDYWQKASCPSAPSIRPYFGDLTLGLGTYEQTFIVVPRL